MFNDIQRWFRDSGAVGRVILINLFVFLIVNFVGVVFTLAGNPLAATDNVVVRIFSLPAALGSLLIKPWSPFTYMFVHEDLWHIGFNMLMLYFSGRIMADLLGGRRFVFSYLGGGLAGALVFVLAYNIFPLFALSGGSTLIGASAGVMGVFIAAARYFPNFEVYLFGLFKVRLKWIAIFYVISDFVALKGMSNLGGHFAHLGGAAFGYLFANALLRGNDWSVILESITAMFDTRHTPKPRIKVVHKSYDSIKTTVSAPSLEEEVDRILDKINHTGYNSLTKEEKDILLKASKE
ncbi:MAG TPA: rhomboid family intramembrane serine protease [Luteibaculaceae bacterium]|nr:rhomboid family intramembrane serine protease [Luteibaculaceae bacterium]